MFVKGIIILFILIVNVSKGQSFDAKGKSSKNERHILKELLKFDKWSFDIFELSKYTDRPLTTVIHTAFKKRNLFQSLNINETTLRNYFTLAEDVNTHHEYHNTLHLASVVHTCHVLLNARKFQDYPLSDEDIMSTLLACGLHDLGHPGKDNICLKQPIPEYDNFEAEHIDLALSLLNKPMANILENFDEDTQSRIKQNFKSLVYATSISTHGEVIKQAAVAKKKLDNGATDPKYMLSLLAVITALSAEGDAVQPLPRYLRWLYKLMLEWFAQGQAETAMGRATTDRCDPDRFDVVKAEKGFFTYVLHPLVDSVISFTGDQFQFMAGQLDRAFQWLEAFWSRIQRLQRIYRQHGSHFHTRFGYNG